MMTSEKQRYKEIKRVTLLSVALNVLLATTKVIVGYFGRSHALFADGIHSFSDIVTDTFVLVAAKFGSQKPDEEHPYGHGRIETVASIIIAILIALVGIAIVYDASLYIVAKGEKSHPSIVVILIAALNIGLKEWIYRYTLAVSKRIGSHLLHTHAWHNRSDAVVSFVVLIGVLGTFIGFTALDAIAAIVIGLLILKMSAKMIWDSLRELIDTAVDKTTIDKIKAHINQLPGVVSLHQLRTRSHGNNVFADVHILVNPHISVSEGHYIGEHVRLSLIKHFSRINDVTVHIDPEDDEKMAPSLHLPNRKKIKSLLKTCWEKLPGYSDAHPLQIHYLSGSLHIELTLPETTLKKANCTLTELTHQYQQAATNIKNISHIKIHLTP